MIADRRARRFWLKVAVARGGCWEWTASRGSNGYGRFRVATRTWGLAHRWSYEWFVGPIPTGLTIDHTCRNRACVNPSHLEAVTNRENILRGVSPAATRAVQTHCNRGHLLAGDNLVTSPGRYGPERRCRECHRAWQRERYRKRVAA